MRYASVRAVYRIIACAGMFLVGGCSGYIRQAAVDGIASQVQPPNSAVVHQLESTGNPTGEGVIVFVRSGSDCGPRYSWLWLNNRTPSYALDRASQALTPRLRTLSEASRTTVNRVGSEGQTLGHAIRESVCHTARR
jgi:hypothetical protein